MGLYHRYLESAYADVADCLPLVVDGATVGWIDPAMVPRLAAEAAVFAVTERTVTLAPALGGAGQRTAAVNAALRRLYDRDRTGFGRWCDERSAVRAGRGGPVAFEVERAAAHVLGVVTEGVSLNGYVRTAAGLAMWVARRARHIAAQPGELDQLAAGFLPAGADPLDQLRAEAAEEAGIPAALTAAARPAGSVAFQLRWPPGIPRGRLLIHDLELPATFRPVNRDGEVEEFLLLPLDAVVRTLEDGPPFKFDCGIVAIDFLVRHGAIGPGHPAYTEIRRSLARGTAAADRWRGTGAQRVEHRRLRPGEQRGGRDPVVPLGHRSSFSSIMAQSIL